MFPGLDFEFLSFCFHSNVAGGMTLVIRGMMQAHSWPVSQETQFNSCDTEVL